MVETEMEQNGQAMSTVMRKEEWTYAALLSKGVLRAE
jgi:hypothetical protein